VASAGQYASLHLTPAPHHSVFYRPDALPAAQLTVSEGISIGITMHVLNKVENIDHTPDIAYTLQRAARCSPHCPWACFFSKKWTSAILRLLGAHWDHPRWQPGGLYHCAKFGWNRCSSFDNMKLSVFRPLGLKLPIHSQKLWAWGDFTPKMGINVNETPKPVILEKYHSVVYKY